jgi:hypothetical protein
MAKKRYLIKDLRIDELSLVDAGAVGEGGVNFVLYKRAMQDEKPTGMNEEEYDAGVQKAWEAMTPEEQLDFMKKAEWFDTFYQIEMLSKALTLLEESNPDLYKELNAFPERFDIDEDTFEITWKADAPLGIPQERKWNGERWVR